MTNMHVARPPAITWQRAKPVFHGVVRHFRRYWAWYAPAVLSLVLFGRYYCIELNMTESLRGSVYLVFRWQNRIEDLKRGDYVAFQWHGGLNIPRGITFTKIVEGLPGDVVQVAGEGSRDFLVNGRAVGHAKEFARGGWTRLEPAAGGVIPKGRIYVRGTHIDSLDSRYRVTGLIEEGRLVGRAVLLW